MASVIGEAESAPRERGSAEPGSGLGLAIARAYAQAHGGDLMYHHDDGAPRFELVVPSTPRRS